MAINCGWESFSQEINKVDEDIDLAKACLYYAKAEYVDLNISEYLNILALMAEEIESQLRSQQRYPLKVVKLINKYLFEELGYQGNLDDYYNVKNSFLNDVIDRRMGIPITISVIYLEIAKRINFPMVGIGMPGHFLIRPDFEDSAIFIDPFNKGEILFPQDCQEKLSQLYQEPIKLESRFLAPVSNRQILARMLTNLKFIYLRTQQLSKALGVIDGILMLFPENPNELRDRGLIYYELNSWYQATQDLECYLSVVPNAEDAPMIRLLLEKIR
jgi:regulator of sirC expression with transglutaminase-like and TPR domain